MEGDLQELADHSAKKNYVVDDQGNLVNPTNIVETKDELEETKQEADKLEQEFKFPNHHKRMTKAQLSESLTNLEREKSRQGNELGELRKQVDELLKAPAVERKPIEAEQLLEDPDNTLNSAISENEKIKELEAKLERYETNNKEARFYNKHPDAESIVNSPEFSEYLQIQPIAGRAVEAAMKSGDHDILGDVLDSYKSFQGKSLRDQSEQKRDKELSDAQMESGSTGSSSKKVYSRGDLINLRINDPQAWAANEAEYMKAYAEGRVK